MGSAAAANAADAEPRQQTPPASLWQFWSPLLSRPPQFMPQAAELEQQSPRAQLGKRLFSDKRLSGDGTMSCATCHQPDKSFTDGLPRRPGRTGTLLRHNTPTLLNIGGARRLHWMADVAELESQIDRPVLSPNEMDGDWTAIVTSLAGEDDMRRAFKHAFPNAKNPVTTNHIKQALTAYQRTIISPLTRFDAALNGDHTALSAAERRGFALYVGKAGCIACHNGWRLSDDRRHQIGLSALNGPADQQSAPRRTPPLRDIARTAPYMHDGRFETLVQVTAHYQLAQTRTGSDITMVPKDEQLSETEIADLIAFLQAL